MYGPRRVIVGTSGSPGNLCALRYAEQLARACGATLIPVHTWAPPGGDIGERRRPCMQLRRVWAEDAGQRLREALAAAWGQLPADLTVQLIVERGDPGRVLTFTRRFGAPYMGLWAQMLITIGVSLWLGVQYNQYTAFALTATVIVDVFVPLYILLNVACIVYFARFRRGEFNWLLHGLIPVLGIAAFIPAFLAGAGIPVFSFIIPLSKPLSYAGPAVGGMGGPRADLPGLPVRAAPGTGPGDPPGLHPRGAAASGRGPGPFRRHPGNDKLTA